MARSCPYAPRDCGARDVPSGKSNRLDNAGGANMEHLSYNGKPRDVPVDCQPANAREHSGYRGCASPGWWSGYTGCVDLVPFGWVRPALVATGPTLSP